MTLRKRLAYGLGLGLLVAAVVLGIYAAVNREDRVAPEARQRLVVTRDHRGGPPSCRPRRIADLVVGFFDAFNRGDSERLATMFEERTFQWYSVEGIPGERSITVSPYDINTLGAYFASRHEQDERLRLIEIRIADAGVRSEVQGERIPPTPAAGVEFILERDARDFVASDETLYGGNALLDCRQRTILYWSTGPDAVPAEALCPPHAASGTADVIACTGLRRVG